MPLALCNLAVGGLLAFGSVLNGLGMAELPVWLAMLLGYGVSLIWLSVTASSTGERPLLLLSLFYLTYGLLLPALYQVAQMRFPWPSAATTPDRATVAAVMNLTFMAILAASHQLLPSRPPSATIRQARHFSAPRTAAFACSALAFALAGLVFLKFGPRVMFGPVGVLALVSSHNPADKMGYGLTFILARGVALGALAIAIHVTKKSNTFHERSIALSALMLAVAANVMVNFPGALPRFQLLALLAVIGFSAVGSQLFRSGRLALLCAPVAVYVVFPIIQEINRGARFKTEFRAPDLRSYMYHGDFDGFQSILNAIALTQSEGFSMGRRLVSAALFFVPRAIWEGKADPTGADAALVAGYRYFNISMPIPGEFYSDFGWLGICFGALALGWLIKRGDSIYQYASRASGVDYRTPLVVLVAAHAPILWRGSLLGIIAPVASACAVVGLWVVVSRLLTVSLGPAATNGRVARR